MRVLQISNPQDLIKTMQEIRVDPYGIKIMAPKGITHLVKLKAVPTITATILKQEMLSLGGDVAVARDALMGKLKAVDCLLIGNLAQFSRLEGKLKQQPFGLRQLSRDLSLTLNNYQKESFVFEAGRFTLRLGEKARVMGIVNVTPDSFSGDGLLVNSNIKNLPQGGMPPNKYYRCGKISKIVEYAQRLVTEGADIIDVGGESTRPGARQISAQEELKRVIPAIKALARKIKVPLSVDTRKPEVARQALENGAVIVNDISGLRDVRMAKVAARYRAGVVIMHMKGASPKTMQGNPTYASLIDEITAFLTQAIERAEEAGISRNSIIVDPGLGFGKTFEHNLQIVKNLREFKVLGRPLLVGPSRKSFIGKILNAGPQERIFGTVSAAVVAVKNGANIVRVHDCLAVKQALAVCFALNTFGGV